MADFRDDLKNFERRFKLNIEKLLSADFLQELGNQVTTTIYKRVKAGGGAEDGQKTRLKPLSSGYISARKGTVQFNTKEGKFVEFKIKKTKLGNFGSAGRSNLTRTGQMLDSIDFKVTKNGVTIFIPDSFRDDDDSKQLTNADVARFVTKQGRSFFELTDSEVTSVQRTIINKLRILAKNV